MPPTLHLNVTRPKSPHPKLRWIIGAVTLTRLFINTARRFAYPFAPVLSRNLGVTLPAVTSIIAINQLTGVLGILFAPIADRWGYRNMMLVGLGLLTVGMFIGGAFPFYATVLIALFLGGLGKTVFDPSLQAYVGQRVPYIRRGLTVGIIETSWAGSSLIGIPFIGLIMDRYGWRSPFFFLCVVSILGLIGLKLLIPDDRLERHVCGKKSNILAAICLLAQKREAIGAIGFSFFLSAANDNLFVVYGAWLEKTFSLGVVALGATTMIIGAAEFLGEMLTAFLADRVGLLRVIITGTIFTTASYLMLPVLGHSLPFALTTLFILFVSVECSIVTTISLCTEVMPEARATMMSGYLAAASLGRVTGALMGGPVWLMGGIHGTGIVSACIGCIALLFIGWGFSGWRPAFAPPQSSGSS